MTVGVVEAIYKLKYFNFLLIKTRKNREFALMGAWQPCSCNLIFSRTVSLKRSYLSSHCGVF